MIEYVTVRASEILHQSELVAFLKSNFPSSTKPLGRTIGNGTETVEARVPSNSRDFKEIRDFVLKKRQQGLHGYCDFTIGRYLRKYSKQDLKDAEVLRLIINSHFDPSGEECGTIYETLCGYCNWGRQASDLILDLRRVPQNKDVLESIAWVEWIVSAKFVDIFTENKLSGADFRPVFDLRNPTKSSKNWQQLRPTSTINGLTEKTVVGKDPFSPSEVSWRCPLGHSVAAAFLSEVYLNRTAWDGSDIAVTSALFGQGQYLLRPTPLIIISQRMYRTLDNAGIKGLSYECVHLS